MHRSLAQDLTALRSSKPLVLNLTNYVTMDFVANGLLAAGASPLMAHSPNEMYELIAISSAVSINIGTLDEAWVDYFLNAAKLAKAANKPVALDPVGAGATKYRTNTAVKLLETGAISILRGNASEILAIAGQGNATKGVDATNASHEALDAAGLLAKKYEITVVVTGQDDIVASSQKRVTLPYGTPVLTKVTGIGCLLNAIIAAFSAVNKDEYEAACNALIYFNIAAELAAEQEGVAGPASFRTHFLDMLYNITAHRIIERASCTRH